MMKRVALLYFFASVGLAGSARAAVLTVCASGCTHPTIQAAINAAQAGDVIQLHAGTTYNESVVLKNKGALSSYITITTDASAGSLPGANIRTDASYAAFMPKLKGAGGGAPAVSTETGANHYKFQHIEFLAVPGNPGLGWNDMVQLGDPGSAQQFEWQEPYAFIIDQCYLHGDPVAGQKRGIDINAKDVTITNSYLSQFVAVGQDSQCIAGFNGHGPVRIENNYLECGTENIIFGGGDPWIRTFMRATGTPTTSSASVTTYETSHTLSELHNGQLIAIKTHGGTQVEHSFLTGITGNGASGTLTWSPPLTAAPDVPGDLRAGVVFDTITIRRNYFTKQPSWRNGVLATPTSPSATGSTAGGSLAAGNYCYQVQAFSNQGFTGQWVNGGLATERCASIASTGKVTVTWTAVAGATTYRVWRGASAGAENKWADAPTTTFVDDGTRTYTNAAPVGATQWQEKNLFEIKQGRNYQIDSNIFYYQWNGNTAGYAWWIKSANQEGQHWWAETTNVTLENNLIHGVDGWFLIHGREVPSGSGFFLPYPVTNITIKNNLVYDSNGNYGNQPYAMNVTATTNNLTIDHNTVVNTASAETGGLMAIDTLDSKSTGWVLQNNMFRREGYGVHDSSGEGTVGLNVVAPGFIWRNNGLDTVGTVGNGMYPAGNGNVYSTTAQWEAAFTAYSFDGTGANYTISSGAGGAPYRNAGSDGKDIGADIAALDAAIADVGTGSGSSLTITTPSVPNGTVGTPYSATMQAQGGVPPYSWNISSGTAPPGLSLSSSGDLTGTPTAAGSFNYVIRVTDSASSVRTQPISQTVVASTPEVVIYATDATEVVSRFAPTADGTAAQGIKLATPDQGAATVDAPAAAPTADYVEAVFSAPANTKYRLWLRLKGANNSKFNESVWVQFSDSTDAQQIPIYRIGTTAGLLVNLENCNACGISGWGWQNKAYWLSDTGEVWFQNNGVHTIRIQVREDGVQLDQIVLSPFTYLTNAPGPVTNDATIVPKPAGNTPPTSQLTAPASGAVFQEPAHITLAATATDSDGVVNRVDFYAGTTLLGSDTGAPYAFDWWNVPAGPYTLTAVAIDNYGATTTSSPVSITVTAANPPEVVIHAADVGQYFGAFVKVNTDTTAAESIKFATADNGAPTIDAPAANPTTDYIEATFSAPANTKYRLWLRLKGTNNSKLNESVWAQFSDSVDAGGNPVYRTGTTNGLLVNLENCSNCGISNWGWQNRAYWLPDTGEIWFATGGVHTVRIQIREDGVQLDQIVLSPVQYVTTSPGPVTNDNTIVPHP